MGGVMGFEPARPGNVPSASARRHFSGRPGTSRPRPALSFEGLAQRANEEASPVPGLKEHETASPRTEIVALIPALRAFARTFYRETSEADDLVQETLTRALTSIHQFRPGTSMKSWLFTIMRNAFYTKVRVETREAPGTAECVSLRPAADATQEWSARGREMERAIQRLPEQQREVLMLIGVRHLRLRHGHGEEPPEPGPDQASGGAGRGHAQFLRRARCQPSRRLDAATPEIRMKNGGEVDEREVRKW
jgi:RNA polymerase sigma factor (sigma-70 family)